MRTAKTSFLTIAIVLGAAVMAGAGDGVWTTTYPGGGNLPDLTIDPATGRLDVSPTHRGLYASTDGGTSWTSYTDGNLGLPFGYKDISTVVRGPDSNLHVITNRLYRSGDDGATWYSADTGISGTVTCVGFDPSASLVLYAGTESGVLYKTTDGTVSWSAVGTGLPAELINTIEVDPLTGANVYVGTAGSGLWKSTDSGASFVRIDNNVVLGEVGDVAVDPSNPQVVYVADGSSNSVYKSSDGGASWTQQAPAFSFAGGGPTILAIDPGNPQILYVASHGEVWKSVDGGTNWTSVAITTVQVAAVHLDPAIPSTLYAATHGDGVFKSIDSGATWNEANNGLQARLFPHSGAHSLHYDATTANLLYTGAQAGGWRSLDNGVTWSRMNGPWPTLIMETRASEPGVVWAKNNGVYKSTDNGVTWADATGGLFGDFNDGDLALHPTDPLTVYVAGSGSGSVADGIYKTTDGGVTWNPVVNGLGNTLVHALAVDPADGDVVYAGVPDYAGPGDGIYKTTDGGANWFQLGGGLPSPINPNQIVVHPADSNLVYVGSATDNGGVYQSTDGGSNWSLLMSENVNAVAVDPGDTSRVYAGTWNTGGFYRSLDGGASWAVINTGLPQNPGIHAITLDPANSARVLIGTDAGALEYTFQGTVTLEVTNSADGGPGTLRDAITQANQDGVPNLITFYPSVAGDYIWLGSPLPALTEDSTTIDGDLEDDCIPDVGVHGGGLGGDGIQVNSSSNVIEGLVVSGFAGNGVILSPDAGPPADNNLIVCNYVGTDMSGFWPDGNFYGIHVRGGGTGNQIGAPGQPNVISGNDGPGLHLMEGPGTVVRDNFIGTTADAGSPLANNGQGVLIQGPQHAVAGASNYQIGPDNLIAYNNGPGVMVEEGQVAAYPDFVALVPDATGQFPVMEFHAQNGCGPFESLDGQIPVDGSGNPFVENFGARFTGTLTVDAAGDYNFEVNNFDVAIRVVVGAATVVDYGNGGAPSSGTISLAAGDHAIEVDFSQPTGDAGIDLQITGPGSATLSSGGQPGLFGELFQLRLPSEGNWITQNSIFDNTDVGIRLGSCSARGNDPGDTDVGPNTLLNSPELVGATDDGGGLYTPLGTAEPGTTVEVFAVAADPSGYGEGKLFLATAVAPGGTWSALINLPDGYFAITATATDASGNTSEFSQNLELRPNVLAVSNNLDSGPGSLRDALNQANSDGVSTEISIDPGLAGQTIFLISGLPPLSEGGTTLDADLGGDCVPDLALDGSLTGGAVGIDVVSSSNVVRGLAVHSFQATGIHFVPGADGNVVECNHVGTDLGGIAALPNSDAGIKVQGADNRIGPGNVIAYNAQHGIFVEELFPNTVYPDFSGLTPDYTGVFPVMEFTDDCATFHSVDGITPTDGGGAPFTENFGGRFTGTLNVDAGGDYNFELQNLDDLGRIVIDGNFVVDETYCCPVAASYYLNAGDHTIEVDFLEGGGYGGFRLEITGPGTATLSTGGQPGLTGELFQVRLAAERNRITQNSIFLNDGLGIGFNCCCGPTQNDPGDADVGSNTVLNFPELSSFLDLGGGSFTVDGTAPPDSTVELFGAAADPSGFGEGKVYLGSTTADPAGNFSLSQVLPAEYDAFTATATDGSGNTSEFSQNLTVKSPDEVNVGTAEGFQGDTVEVPIYVRDLGSTLLGVDQPAGNKIQGFTFQVQFQPQWSVQAISAYHSGTTAGLSPLFDTFTTTGDTITYVVSFDEATNLVPLTLDGPGPGDEVARLVVTIDPGAAPSPINLTVLNGTTLSNQAGTLTETEGAQLGFGHGWLNVRTRAATSLDAVAQSSSDVRLRWNDPQADETGFRIDRSDDGGGSWWTIATVGPDDTEYYDSGLSPTTLYYYQVTAFNGGADAPPSNLAWAETFPATAARTCVTQVGNDHSWMRFPSPAHNGTMWANAFYERNGSTDDEVYFQFHDSWGNPQGGWVALSDNDTQSRFPTMRWNGSHFGVMWSEHMRGPGGEVTSNTFFGLLDGNGQVVRKGVRLFDESPKGSLNSDYEWAFDWDGGGWGNVVPDYFVPSSTNLGFWRFSEDGELLTGPVQISFTTGDERDVSVVWNGSEYGVAWLHHEGSTHELLFRRFLPDGSSPDPGPTTVWQAAPGEDAAYTSLVWNGTGWAVAWDLVDAEGYWPLYLRLLDADGTPLGAVQRMSDDEDPTWPGSGLGPYDELPELVLLPGGGYVAYTSSYSYMNGAYEIARLEADAAGNRVGARTVLSDDDGRHSIFGRVATDGNDHLVVYSENRQGSQETGGMLVAPDGSILSGPNDHSGGHSPGNHYFHTGSNPAAVTPVLDGFLAVWTDQESGVPQIYGQYFDGSGNPSSSWWPLSGRQVNGKPGFEGLGDTFATAFKDENDNVVFDRAHVFGGSFLGEPEIAWGTGGRGDVDLAFSGDTYGVAYFNGNDVELQRVDMNGGLVGGPITVADNGRQGAQVQWTGAGWAVMWRGTGGYLYYALVDAYGNVVAGPTQATANPADNSLFHFLWTGDFFGLAWLNGGSVYFNVLDLSGNPTLGDVMVADPVGWPGGPWLHWTGDRFRLVRGGGDGTRLVDGVREDEILPDGTVFPNVRQLANRGRTGAAAYNGTTLGLLWLQLNETFFQTSECLNDATPPSCPNVSLATSDTAVVVNWDGSDDPESTLWRYNLYRDGYMLAEVFPQNQRYDDFGYRQDTVHTYEVRAMNGAYQESQSCPLAVSTYSTTVGDGNGDGLTDAADVFYLIQYLYGGGPPPQGDADANGDDVLDAGDVFYLINHVFGGGPPPLPLVPGGPADVLALGTVEADAGAAVEVPLYLRDLEGTPLGGGGEAIQGFAFRVDFPAKAVASASFVQAGVTAGKTPVFPVVQAASDHLVVLLKFARASDPLALRPDAPAPGDLVGHLRLELATGLSAGTTVELVLDGASILVNDDATVSESPARGSLDLVDGAVVIGDPSIFGDGFESGDTAAWSSRAGG